jgi:sec-independent protein translocase protein TatA
MFGLGFTEILVILVVALLVFGPDRLPELARNLGKGLAEFRRASSDLRRSVLEAAEEPRQPPAPPAALPPPAGPADEVVAASLPPAGAASSERDPGRA